MNIIKTEITTIDQYIKTFPKDVQRILQQIRQMIRKAEPEAEEDISYKMPTFKLNGKSFIYVAAWKKHISIYPFSSDMVKFLKEASSYQISGKGTIKFPINKPLPLPLIGEIIAFRLNEHRKNIIKK